MRQRGRSRKKKAGFTWPDIFPFLCGFALLVLPLIHSDSVMDPSLMPRYMAWLLFIAILTLVLLKKELFQQLDLSVLRNKVFLFFTIYLAISVISMSFALNITAGYFDLFKSFASVVFLAFCSLVFLNTEGWMVRLSKFFILGSLLALLTGYYQYFNELGIGLHSRHEMLRITGRMSNVNLYANYLFMLFPLVVYGLFVLKSAWRVLAFTALVLTLTMIILLQTRAAYLAMGAGVMFFLLVMALSYKSLHIPVRIKNTILLLGLGGFLAASALVVIAPGDHVIASRVRSIFSGDDPRLLVWRASIDLIADQPLTGVGAGNFPIRVQQYYGVVDFGNSETNWLRPHNDYIWVLAEKGVFGLMAYLSVFVVVFLLSWKAIHHHHSMQGRYLALLIASGIFGTLVNAFFDFPLERINHQVVLMMMMAGIITLAHQISPPRKQLSVNKNILLATIFVACLGGILHASASIKVEKQVRMARNASASRQWDEAIRAAQKAKTPWRTLDALAVPVSFFEAFALTQKGDTRGALQAFLEAYRHNPYRKYITNNIGILYMQSGKPEKAIGFFQKSLEMYPRDIESQTYLIEAYVVLERYDQAVEIIDRIAEEKLPDSLKGLRESLIEFIDKDV